jgi:hypothetical protein
VLGPPAKRNLVYASSSATEERRSGGDRIRWFMGITEVSMSFTDHKFVVDEKDDESKKRQSEPNRLFVLMIDDNICMGYGVVSL